MRKTVGKRIKVTKTGKLMRRKMAQSHFRAKKSGSAIRAKRPSVKVSKVDIKTFKKYL
ncbi:MAG TPA: 50S ribosomal protein L35 [Candidatus Colwellbacteria bacterium]|jgi:ribosomal protein L35|nr:50S ribosomal protein L35 [Candidatus Colwellbacteria bacterium]